MNGFRLKREKFDVMDSSMTCVLFVVLENLFLLLYYALPTNVRSIAVVGLLGSFGLELMFAIAGFLTANIRGADFFKAAKMNKKINWPIVGIAFLIALVSIYGFSSFSNYFIMTLEEFGYQTSLSNIEITNVFSYILYLFLVCAVPAIFEEICFRGVICAGLESKNKHLAVWLSAFIFMVMHGGPEQTIHQLILGVIFGYIFVYTGNLWVTVLIHFFNNAIAVTMMFIQGVSASGASGEAAPVGFEGMTSFEVVMGLMSSVVMAVTAGVLVYFLVKAIKKQLTNLEKPQVETVTNEQTDLAVNQENVVGAEQSDKHRKSGFVTAATVIMFVLSIGYLIFEWMIALINGFLI